MPEVDYGNFRGTVDRMIARWGMITAIRRNGVDYPCKAVITNFSPLERQSDLINLTDRKVLLSPVDLSIEPNKDTDVLVVYQQPMPDDGSDPVVDSVLKIVAPPGRINMAGTNVLWRLQVRL